MLLSTFTVESTADDGPGSLRWAIAQANSDTDAGPSFIEFDIPGGGVRTISLQSPLDALSRPVVIDARTQPGYAGIPLIRLDGSNSRSAAWNGLVLSGGGSVLAGLIVTGFSGAGVVLNGPGGDNVESSYVGLTPGGAASPNGVGIQIWGSSLNTIGGPGPLGNVISGNRGAGVSVVSVQPGDAIGNAVVGNGIGTDGSGTTAIGNGLDGVAFSGATSGRIQGNVISGNLGNGIALRAQSAENLVVGNVVGLTADGRSALGNLRDGLVVDGSKKNIVGGKTPDDANQFSGNLGSGIRALNDSSGLLIQGNQIGTDAGALLTLGNQGDGVTLASSNVTIGGEDAGAGNVIAYNGMGTTGAGVQFLGGVRGDMILSNRIYSNFGLGIDLNQGPTPNHPPGLAPGPNDWINYPLLQTAFTNGVLTTAVGSFLGMPSRVYTIQFFWTSMPDRSGFGEGERYLGETAATTDAQGVARFSLPISSTTMGGFLSATATDKGNRNTSEFSQTVQIQPWTDLNVVMTADPVLAPQGSLVTYTATVTNRGYLSAHNVDLASLFPAFATVLSTSASRGVAASGSGPNARVRIDTLAPGEAVVLEAVVSVPTGFVGNLAGSATATMQEVDAHPGDETATAIARLTAVVDVSLAVSSAPASAHVGDLLAYVFTAANDGPGTATGVTFTLPIAPGTTYQDAFGTQGVGAFDGSRLTVQLGSLGPGASASVTVWLRAGAEGLYAASAGLTASEYDADPSNQSASISTQVRRQADLRVAMSAPPIAASGREIVYGVTVTNAGPETARNVVLRDLIPSQSAFVAASFDGGSASFANGIVTGLLDSLAPGSSATLWIVVRPSAAAGTVLTNAARASSDADDEHPADDAAWATTLVRPVSDLSATIQPDAPTIYQDSPATFRVRVTNKGPEQETDAVLTVPFGSGIGVVSASATQGDAPILAEGLATFRLGSLAAGASAWATIVLAPPPGFSGTLVQAATVGGANFDEDPTDNGAATSLTVVPVADLAVYVAPPDTAHERTTFQYSLTAANLSDLPDDGVQLSAPLPDGVEFVSAVSSQGTSTLLKDGRVIAALGTLPGGSTATLTITVRTTASAGSQLLLSGAATGTLPDSNNGNDVGRYAVDISPCVDLMVRLRPSQNSVEVGESVVWTADVWNSSTTTATGVALSVPYAAGGSYLGSAATQGTVDVAGGVLTAYIGTLAPGTYATVAFLLRPLDVGSSTLAAQARADQFVSPTAEARSAALLNVLEPPGTIQFASAAVAVPETAGVAYIPVTRAGGARGAVSVAYRTTAGSAAPNVDYQPISGVLTFQPGQTLATIAVPVMPYAHNGGGVSVGLVLEGPTGGASLGNVAGSSLTIQDVDPDFTAPTVGRLRLLGGAESIGGLALDFSEPLRPDAALNGSAYTLFDLGRDGVYGDGDDTPIAYLPPGYDPATRTVYITPAVPMAVGRSYAIIVRGSGPNGLVDLAGNPLGGGVEYVSLFARGPSLKYTDSNGDDVSLQLKSGGYMDLIRSASGDARTLSLRGIVPGRSSLSGSVSKPRGRGDGITTIDAIEGLGSFGDVRVSLKSPPFITRSLPTIPSRPGRPIVAQGRAALPRKFPATR